MGIEMKTEWTEEGLRKLQALLDDKNELYAFIDEKENILEMEFFLSTEAAVNYARTFDTETVYVFQHVGCAENKNEEFTVYDKQE